MELDVWRFRLLETTFLKLANAAFRDDGQPLMLDDIEKDLPANSSKLLTESKWTFITQELMLLSLLKGVGSEVMLVEEVELLLNELLNHHHQFYLGNDQLCMKLSKIEVNTMCLLQEVIQFQVTMMMVLLLPWSLLLLEVVLPSQKRSSSFRF
ncbi:uncharacterized protein LOC141665041 isoform X2 [Apium graveolens]